MFSPAILLDKTNVIYVTLGKGGEGFLNVKLLLVGGDSNKLSNYNVRLPAQMYI